MLAASFEALFGSRLASGLLLHLADVTRVSRVNREVQRCLFRAFGQRWALRQLLAILEPGSYCAVKYSGSCSMSSEFSGNLTGWAIHAVASSILSRGLVLLWEEGPMSLCFRDDTCVYSVLFPCFHFTLLCCHLAPSTTAS